MSADTAKEGRSENKIKFLMPFSKQSQNSWKRVSATETNTRCPQAYLCFQTHILRCSNEPVWFDSLPDQELANWQILRSFEVS